MARYTDLDQCATDALALVERVRDEAPFETYQHLARQCRRDPERMAQIVMMLALFVDPAASTGDLQDLIDDSIEGRMRDAARVAGAVA